MKFGQNFLLGWPPQIACRGILCCLHAPKFCNCRCSAHSSALLLSHVLACALKRAKAALRGEIAMMKCSSSSKSTNGMLHLLAMCLCLQALARSLLRKLAFWLGWQRQQAAGRKHGSSNASAGAAGGHSSPGSAGDGEPAEPALVGPDAELLGITESIAQVASSAMPAAL